MPARGHIEEVLRGLCAERDRLEAELQRTNQRIRLLETALEEWPDEARGSIPAPPEPPSVLPPAAAPYAGMSLIEAALAALRAHGDQDNADLAKILIAGGFKTRAEPGRFRETLRAMLRRPEARKAGIRRAISRSGRSFPVTNRSPLLCRDSIPVEKHSRPV